MIIRNPQELSISINRKDIQVRMVDILDVIMRILLLVDNDGLRVMFSIKILDRMQNQVGSLLGIRMRHLLGIMDSELVLNGWEKYIRIIITGMRDHVQNDIEFQQGVNGKQQTTMQDSME
jgi:hypothetical protein